MSWSAVAPPVVVVLAAVLLPGLAVATAARLRGIAALGVAGPLGYAIVGITGVVGGALHVPFGWPALLVATAVLVVLTVAARAALRAAGAPLAAVGHLASRVVGAGARRCRDRDDRDHDRRVRLRAQPRPDHADLRHRLPPERRRVDRGLGRRVEPPPLPPHPPRQAARVLPRRLAQPHGARRGDHGRRHRRRRERDLDRHRRPRLLAGRRVRLRGAVRARRAASRRRLPRAAHDRRHGRRGAGVDVRRLPVPAARLRHAVPERARLHDPARPGSRSSRRCCRSPPPRPGGRSRRRSAGGPGCSCSAGPRPPRSRIRARRSRCSCSRRPLVVAWFASRMSALAATGRARPPAVARSPGWSSSSRSPRSSWRSRSCSSCTTTAPAGGRSPTT